MILIEDVCPSFKVDKIYYIEITVPKDRPYDLDEDKFINTY